MMPHIIWHSIPDKLLILPRHKKTFVCTTNGHQVPVVGKGSVPLSDNLNLDSVLVVPSLKNNLLSAVQITNVLNCIVIIWPSHCIFKDIQTR